MTNNSLKTQIQEDMKNAMRAHERLRLGTVRMLLSAIKQREIDEKITLDDTQILAVIEKMIKQRRDACEQFTKASRQDLADTESAEIEVLQNYLPTPFTEQEIQTLIEEAIDTTQAATMQDMGKVMAIIKPKAQGRADMGQISAKIKAILAVK